MPSISLALCTTLLITRFSGIRVSSTFSELFPSFRFTYSAMVSVGGRAKDPLGCSWQAPMTKMWVQKEGSIRLAGCGSRTLNGVINKSTGQSRWWNSLGVAR